jgi:hypothetical protein
MFGIIHGKELSSTLLFYLILTSELITGCRVEVFGGDLTPTTQTDRRR